ncbi:amidohydrolase family protein [Ensifer sp. NPDC090286]|uniref:amidohydrolase family protein n=1 Tax=Ensifer sp. NPDC090286 TaxID=3363991 RepID=UPI00383B0BCF
MLATDASVERALTNVRVSLAKDPADLLLKNCSLVNVWSDETYTTSIAIAGDRIVAIRRDYEGAAKVVIDCAGRYVLPGFIEPLASVPDVSEALASTLLAMGVTSIVLDENCDASGRYDDPVRLRRWHLSADQLGWQGATGKARRLHEQLVCNSLDQVADCLSQGRVAVLGGEVDPSRTAALLAEVSHSRIETARILLRNCNAGAAPSFNVNPALGSAIKAGVPACLAAQMTCLNAAIQYAIDHEVGSVTPGRLADLLVVDELGQPIPSLVIAGGVVAARSGQLEKRKKNRMHAD